MKTKIKKLKNQNAIVLTSNKSKLVLSQIRVRNQVCGHIADNKNLNVLMEIHSSYKFSENKLTDLAPELSEYLLENKRKVKYLILVHDHKKGKGFNVSIYKIDKIYSHGVLLIPVQLPDTDFNGQPSYELFARDNKERLIQSERVVLYNRSVFGKLSRKVKVQPVSNNLFNSK